MKIAIVGGGGAGLSAAWLLGERHDVTLFERDGRLGGHVQTVLVDDGGSHVPVSAGFQFFSRRMYPRFVRLLELLGVPLVDYEQTLTFYDRSSGRIICMPPTGSLARWTTLFGMGNVSALAGLAKLLGAAEPHVERGDWSITFGEFLGRVGLSPRVVADFVLPFFASNWGVPTDAISGLSARAVLSYTTLHRPVRLRTRKWTEVEGGMQRYIEAIRDAVGRERISSDRRVLSVRRGERGWDVVTAAGVEAGFDQIVFATNARDASAAIRELPGSGALRPILDGIEYFDTRIVVHRDTSLMPADRARWSNVNLARERGFCAIHHWAGWRRGVDVFRSWMTHYETMPRDVVAEVVYQHARPTPRYYAAQSRLADIQGRDGLWFAGVWTRGFDSHESAVCSSIEIARRLGGGDRLASLLQNA